MNALARLEQILTEKHAPIVQQLEPGLMAARVRAHAASLHLQLEPEVVDLYAWHDGTRNLDAPGVPQLFPGGLFLSLERAMENYRESVDTALRIAGPDDAADLYDPAWFPLFVDAGGNVHVSVMQPRAIAGSIWFIPLGEPELRYAVAGNLVAFVELVVELFERGAYMVEPDGALSTDYRAVAAIMRRRMIPKPNVPVLVADLESADHRRALQAFDTIRRLLFPEAVEPLIEATRSPNPVTREMATQLLGMIGGSTASRG